MIHNVTESIVEDPMLLPKFVSWELWVKQMEIAT